MKKNLWLWIVLGAGAYLLYRNAQQKQAAASAANAVSGAAQNIGTSLFNAGAAVGTYVSNLL